MMTYCPFSEEQVVKNCYWMHMRYVEVSYSEKYIILKIYELRNNYVITFNTYIFVFNID